MKKMAQSSKSFTLIELMMVITIIAVLASVGFVQYAEMAERGRASEAKELCGRIKDAEEIYIAENDEFTDDITKLGVGTIPTPVTGCQSSHFFIYQISGDLNTFVITATRCTGVAGKFPPYNSGAPYDMELNVNRDTGSATWTGKFSR